MAGLFFCLASAGGYRAFILTCYNTPKYKRLQWLLYRPCSLYRKRHKTALQVLFQRFAPFCCRIYQTDTSGHNTHLRHVGAHHNAASSPSHTRYQHHTGRCTGQPGGVSSSACTGSARRLAIWNRSAVRAHRVSPAPSTRRGKPAARARRAARNHWRLPPHLFSGCRPIANSGQQ